MDSDPKRPRFFYGWYIVAASLVNLLYTGGVAHFGFTAVFEPIANEFKWSYAQISLASSLRGLEMGLLAPVVGFLVDKWGPKKMVFGGSIFLCLGFLLLSRVESLLVFYLAFVLIAFGMSFSGGTVIMTAVANWFQKKAGLAMGIVVSGFGLGGLLIPIVTLLVDTYEWRTAMVIIGFGTLGIVLPLSFIMRHRPEDYGYNPDGEDDIVLKPEIENKEPVPETGMTVRQALKSRVFWQLSIASSCHSFLLGAVVTHMMPYLSSLGVERSTGSFIAMILPVVSIVGRLNGGWLGDRYGRKKVFTTSFFLMTIGVFIYGCLDYSRLWLLVPFILALSLGWGGSVTTRLTLLREYFGRRSFGTIMGFMSGVMMVGHITGAPLAGWIYDNWGTYRGAWLAYGAVTLLGAFLVFTLPAAKSVLKSSEEE
ncbi:MAG TPA: MFS transporter [Dehalococcoidia bacterium]|nr:MFS transporter [Dehalococcoidia bacterium]